MEYVVLILTAFNVHANSEEIPDDRRITELVVYSSRIVVKFTPGYTNAQGCDSSSSTKIQLSTVDDPDKIIYSTLLAAAASQQDIGFAIEDCSGQYPKIYRVDTDY